MIEFLKGAEVDRPVAITTPPHQADSQGFVVPSFAQGSILLRNQQGKYHRLEWGPSDPGASADRRRGLAPGTYDLTSYRIVAKDPQGNEWFVSAIAGAHMGGGKVNVVAGQSTQVKVDPSINMALKVIPKPGELALQMPIQGERHSGITIYKNGKRISMGYQVTDLTGKVLTQGTMNYG